jgi:hypothetical protein
MFATAALLSVLIGRGIGGGSWSSDDDRSPTIRTYLPSSSHEVVTLSKYSRLADGMCYAEVRRIVGEPGEEISRNHMDGIPGVMASLDTVMYSWTNGNGSNMNAMFQNDKLVQKAQFGLK